MRNKLSYDLFRSFSKGNISPKITYLTVNINGNYNGLYTLLKRVDSDYLKLNKNDTNAIIFKQPPISYSTEKHANKHKRLISYSNKAIFYKEFSAKAKNKLIKEAYYNQRYPNIYKSDKTYIIHELTDFIFNSKDIDFKNEKIFNSFFNINNIIDWHLLLLLSNNQDGLIKNFYIYRTGTNQPFLFSPWDYDHGYGRDGDGELNLNSFINTKRVGLLNRLLKTNAFNYKKKLLKKYLLLKRKNILTAKNINSMIDKNITTIQPYIVENEKKWPIDSVQYLQGSNFNNEILLMKNWVKKRLPKVENYLRKLQN